MEDVRLLAEELQGEAVADRRRAARLLALLAEESRSAVVPLLSALADEDDEVRDWVTSALENLGPPELTDAEAILQLLASTVEADIQFFALKLLGRLEVFGARHFSPLMRLNDRLQTPVVVAQFLKTLARLAHEESQVLELRKLCQEALNHSDKRVNATARRLLEEVE